jgi:DNA-binding NarL/FixJ family response regulator
MIAGFGPGVEAVCGSGAAGVLSLQGAGDTVQVRNAAGVMARRVVLTRRERQILEALLEGCSNRAIAQRLGTSEQTVKNQLSALYAKVGVSSRLELAAHALKHRLLR